MHDLFRDKFGAGYPYLRQDKSNRRRLLVHSKDKLDFICILMVAWHKTYRDMENDLSMIPPLPARTGSAHVKGRLNVEGSCIGPLVKHQALNGERNTPCTVVLWHDV